ncbi:MAG: alpha-amylase family protein [Caldilineaceae bacterium]
MFDDKQLARETQRTYARVLPRLEQRFAAHLADPVWQVYRQRLDAHFPQLFTRLLALYGDRYDFYYHLETVLDLTARSWLDRPDDLKTLDAARAADPAWYQREQMLGGVCYVDLFAGDLQHLRARIPYFQELGLTYLHLMPLFKAPEGDNDGGYAVSDYRQVDPDLGTMADLETLATELRAAGISLVLDFVFNHTSDEHRWAQAARGGRSRARRLLLPLPRPHHARRLRPHPARDLPGPTPGQLHLSPGDRPVGLDDVQPFPVGSQLSQPAVFHDMAAEMLFLANIGTEVLRLDALAFTWKELGTDCESLPQAHTLVQAFNAVLRIAAPALLFKSEAIVHPDEVNEYISLDECQLSYNPLLMALLWNSLATREVRLLRHSMGYRFAIPEGCAWVNYIRSHDDIGWTFDDGDAGALGINGYDHRRFLNQFYTGRFPGSFARGLPFQENPRTGDARISGTLASLAGLERARQYDNHAEIELSVRRILLLHAVILSIGGIPLIYLGDEIGTLNDYGYRNDPGKAEDSRWVHRPATNWEDMAKRTDAATIQGRIYQQLQHLVHLRRTLPALGGAEMDVINVGTDHVFGFVRNRASDAGEQRILVLANFTEHGQRIDANELRLYGLSYRFHEHISDTPVTLHDAEFYLEPYQVMWLEPRA